MFLGQAIYVLGPLQLSIHIRNYGDVLLQGCGSQPFDGGLARYVPVSPNICTKLVVDWGRGLSSTHRQRPSHFDPHRGRIRFHCLLLGG
jgi:hypothetical protein